MVDANGELISGPPPRLGYFDSSCCEAGAIALFTKQGILLMYNASNSSKHGDRVFAPGFSSVGQALFDPDDRPTRELARQEDPSYTQNPRGKGQV